MAHKFIISIFQLNRFFSIYVLIFMMSISSTVFAQKISLSSEEKLPGKILDVDILGKNNFGTIIYYYGDNNNQLAILDNKMNTKVRKDISVQSKSIQSVQVLDDKIVVLYVQNSSNLQYLKAKVLNEHLSEIKTLILDSLSIHLDNKNTFYAKTSADRTKLLTFTLVRNKGNFHIQFVTFNQDIALISRSIFTVTDKEDVSVRSVKINNHGFVSAVFGYQDKWSNDDYDFSSYLVNYYNPTNKTIYEVEIKNTNTVYKKLITETDLDDDKLYILSGFRNTTNKDNLGFYYHILDLQNNQVLFQKYFNLTEDDVKESKTYDFKNWRDKIYTLMPKKIIPRSDGGLLFIVEGEFSYLRQERSNNYSNFYNPIFNNIPQQVRSTQYNTIGDIMIFSINSDGSLLWKKNIYKSQQSEDDDAIFSSFTLFEAENVLKFIYNEDIFATGNFVEYNVNPLGNSKHVSIFNTEKEKLNLIPKKAVQLDANTLIIPSQNKRNIQFLQIAY